MTLRSTKDGPWCWQSKQARRCIRDAFDATNNVTTALATYDALCEIASDEGRETFATTHAWIQRLSGVSPSTIKKHLAVFADLALVKISTPALRAPSTYVLLSLANDCPSLVNGELALANSTQSAPLATSEESKKKRRRKTEEPNPLAVAVAPSDDDVPFDLDCPEPAATASAKPTSERKPLLDALAACGGSDPLQIPQRAWSAIGAALKDIKAVCPALTVEEIQRRATNYRAHMRGATLTPNALAKHWALCDSEQQTGVIQSRSDARIAPWL